MSLRLKTLITAAAVAAAAMITGPPSFDATDGAEFAVCGSSLQICHSPGYPLFLMLLRTVSMVLSPLYGHLRLLNCLLGALLVPLSVKLFMNRGISEGPSLAAASVLVFSPAVMTQLNSLEVYPLAMTLLLAALVLSGTRLGPYAAGMSVFAGHPSSLLALPMAFRRRTWKGLPLLAALIPVTLLLYVPVRAGAADIAHYGRPGSPAELWGYFTMYSGRLSVPSAARLISSLSYAGTIPGILLLVTALAAVKFEIRRDVPILLALLFLASYSLPDPAGQLWVLLIPLAARSAAGMERIAGMAGRYSGFLRVPVIVACAAGLAGSDRRSDDIAMRWTTDVLSEVPPGAVYRPVAHDTFYAAYASGTLGIRRDIVLSDPYGSFFQLMIPAPVPPYIGDRSVHVSRAWERKDFILHGLIFHPAGEYRPEPDWNSMEIMHFHGTSPDPMAMDILAEALARRMLQEGDPELRDSLAREALEAAGTELTRERIRHFFEI